MANPAASPKRPSASRAGTIKSSNMTIAKGMARQTVPRQFRAS